MKKYSLITSGFCLSLFVVISFTGEALAADCLAIRKQIEEQTDILQRKELAKQGISDCPNDPIINFEYAYAMERLRKYKLALKHYQVSAKLAPKYAKSYFGMGDMYIQLERPGDAIKAYQTGLSFEPDNKRAQNSLEEAKLLAKKQSGRDDGITGFVNPLDSRTTEKKRAAPKAAPSASSSEDKPAPYEPNQALIMQDPEVMESLIAHPISDETLQSIEFDKAGHSDLTGSLDDNQMGAE